MFQLTYNWWAVLLRGIIALLFGLTAFFIPQVTLAVVVSLFAAFALVDGIFSIISGIRARHKTDRWWVLIIQGLLGIGAGVLTFFYPGLVAIALLYLVAAWAIVTGITEIVAAIRLRKEIRGEWLLGLSGLASVVLGVVLVAFPGTGLLVWVWWMGAYAIASGILLIVLSLRLRKLKKNQDQLDQEKEMA